MQLTASKLAIDAWSVCHRKRILRGFHGYPVLGRAEIKDAGEKQALLDALTTGITSSDGVIMSCFEPRDALRIQTRDARFDLNICFECRQIFPHGLNGDRSIPVTRTPEAVFDAALKKHGLRKSKAYQAMQLTASKRGIFAAMESTCGSAGRRTRVAGRGRVA